MTLKVIMPAKDQGFTEDQVEDFKEVFQLFDTKGDGLIQVRKQKTRTYMANSQIQALCLFSDLLLYLSTFI